MRIGEAARVSGVSVRALRHYEDEGLIVPGRLANGYRDYCRPTIGRVLAVRELLASGLPLRLVRQALPEPDAASPTGPSTGPPAAPPAELLAEIAAYRDRLAAHIAALQARQAALDAFLQRADG
ncbi:MerR family transcriptional regulator [Streptomyces sp. 3MP-14]|uniref:MerR family transcriptional regulator n=1 Tax=Streptomyces mimosae TaxID=2586635 RepID=A0A5N6A422_9ACTN|nr:MULTISPECIES: MerR family transcriptional regulator [Streptomyces]KAB8162148.1 MerR family transcriptional regulator [Streptomyces mimosae]KAB8173954.1 MerR family transcriptional regulator [Streptomyces sp. 3MP-14]